MLIETLGILEGRLPPKVLSLAIEWASLHQAELMQNWESIKDDRRVQPYRAADLNRGKQIMLHITDAEYASEYRIRVAFNNGREGVADLRPMIFDEPRTVFAPVKSLSLFQQLFIEHGALCWPGDLDVAPEYIYFLAFRDDESLRGLFEEWGYIKTGVVV